MIKFVSGTEELTCLSQVFLEKSAIFTKKLLKDQPLKEVLPLKKNPTGKQLSLYV